MNIFSAKEKFTEADSEQFITYKFNVEEDFDKIIIRFEYSPDILENREAAVNAVAHCFEKYNIRTNQKPFEFLPINNLIELSLKINGSYIGCSHRAGGKQEIIIESDFSTNGFNRPENLIGEYELTLTLFSICCNIDCNIVITGANEK